MKSTMQIRIAAVALAAGSLLAGCSSGGGNATQEVELSAPNFKSAAQLADASEYLVKAEFTSKPVAQPLEEADYLTYWVADAKITEVFGQRPDVPTKLKVGNVIPIATQLLSDPDTTDSMVSVDSDHFPTKADLPAEGDAIVAYLVYDSKLGGFGPGYRAIGQGKLGQDDTVTMRAVPGDLNRSKIKSKEATADVKSRYQTKSPWKTPQSETVEPAVSGEPVARPTAGADAP